MAGRWGASALYAALALAAVMRGLGPDTVVGTGYDADGTIWLYWWVHHALSVLQNPLHVDLVYAPGGYDLFRENGGQVFDALLAAPLVALLGHPGWQAWHVALVLFANALAFDVLARRLLPAAPAVAATVAFELHPFALYELSYGRPSQALLAFAPLAVAAFVRCSEPGWRAPLAAGVLTTLHALIYWFNGWFLALALFVVALHTTVGHPDRRGLWRRYLAAGAVCSVLIAPAALAMQGLWDAGAIPGSGSGGGWLDLPSDLDNVIDSTQGWWALEALGPPLYLTVVTGVPLLLWLLLGPGRGPWAFVFVAAAAFAVGPLVEVAGQRFSMPHYLIAWHGLPFLERLWHPYRFLSIAALASSLGVGFLLTRWPRLALPAVVGLVAGTAAQYASAGLFPLTTRSLEAPALVTWLGTQEGTVLTLPLNRSGLTYVWQAHHHRPLFGGPLDNAPVYWPERYRERLEHPTVRHLERLLEGRIEPLDAEDRAALAGWDVRWILLDRSSVSEHHHRPERMVATALGEPTAIDGSLVLWSLGDVEAPDELAWTLQREDEPWTRRSYEHPVEHGRRMAGVQ